MKSKGIPSLDFLCYTISKAGRFPSTSFLFLSMMNTVKRSLMGLGAAAAFVPVLAFAQFVPPTAPDAGTGLAAKVLEVITDLVQYPFTVLGTGSNFYIVGYFMLGVMALGLVAWLRRKMTFGR